MNVDLQIYIINFCIKNPDKISSFEMGISTMGKYLLSGQFIDFDEILYTYTFFNV